MLEQTNYFETDYQAPNVVEDVDKRTTRWLVFAGDKTPPEFKERFDGMPMGGENLGHDFKCLVLSKFLLRRCELTPMVVGKDFVNSDNLGGDFSKVKSYQWYDEKEKKFYTLYYYEKLPGDELEGLNQICQGSNDCGIREVKVLRGVEPPKRKEDKSFTYCKAIDYQLAIFPEWKEYVSGRKAFFKRTSDLVEYLEKRKLEVKPEVRSVIDVILASNAQFERWAANELDKQSRFVKAPPTEGGKVYGWEPVQTQFFDDLDLNKEAFLTKKSDRPESTNEVTREEFLTYQTQNQALLAQLAETNQRLVDITLARTPLENPKVKSEDEKRFCSGLTANNQPCKSFVKGDSEFCVMHQPKGE